MLVQNLSKEEANVCKLWDSVLIVLSSHNKYMQRGSANSTNHTRQIFKKKKEKRKKEKKRYTPAPNISSTQRSVWDSPVVPQYVLQAP